MNSNGKFTHVTHTYVHPEGPCIFNISNKRNDPKILTPDDDSNGENMQ
jgi:hypothetical protein